MIPSSWPTREAAFAALNDPLDVLVVGGGVVGAGIAWDAAQRGLRVAVLDKGDFASGASSKSSKLLHGGLRYLENFEFGLVFESLAERNRLFEDAPHVAQKLDFLFPAFKGGRDPAWKLGAGLFVYDVLAAASRPKELMWHKRLSAAAVHAAEPHIRQEGLRAAYRYTDGVTEDARLVIETMKSAVGVGATALNHVAVEGFTKHAERVTGVQARDLISGRPFAVNAKLVFNATGPWADALRRLDDPAAQPLLRPTKGVHILTRRFTSHAVVMRSHWPGEKAPRVMFVIPWQGRTMIGTTDTDHQGAPGDDSYLDRDVEASPTEVQYLLDAVNASFDVALTPDDVISAFAGWRPLIAPPDAGMSESAVSREHEIFTSPSGLITIAGGKLTGYRAMARESVDAIVAALTRRNELPAQLLPSRIEHALLAGSQLDGQPLEAYMGKTLAANPTLPSSAVAALVMRHGSHWPLLHSLVTARPELLEPLGEAHPGEYVYYQVEAVYAVHHEGAMTLADFLMRRTRAFLLLGDQGLAIAPAAARVLAGELATRSGWSASEREAWIARELASYHTHVAKSRGTRQPDARAAG